MRIDLCSALAVMALAGLCELHPQYGLVPAVILGLTSPAALHGLARVRRRRGRMSRTTTGIRVDDAMLDRRFDDIARRLRESDDSPGF